MADLSYLGCNIIIQNSNNNEILKTVVRGYDKKQMRITINESFDKSEIKGPLVLLIMTREGIHEYSGNIQKVAAGINTQTEIGLFKGIVIENRKAERFDVNLDVAIDNMYFNSSPARLLKPMKVEIANISATGVLINGKVNAFRNKDILEIKVTMNNEINLFLAEIVRIKNIGNACAEFGCKFVPFVKENQESVSV